MNLLLIYESRVEIFFRYFTSHIKNIKNSVSSSINSLNFLRQSNYDTKAYLFKTIIQPKIAYSYPIYHLLSFKQKQEIQKAQNGPLNSFVFGHLNYTDRPNSEACHVILRLKSITQIAWERGRKFHEKLKKTNPTLYEMFCLYTELPINSTKSTISRPSTLQYALGPRPDFIYNTR